MNGNALSLKNVRLKKFIKTRCALKDLKQCNNYAMYLIDSVQSVSLTESFCYHPTTSAYKVKSDLIGSHMTITAKSKTSKSIKTVKIQQLNVFIK